MLRLVATFDGRALQFPLPAVGTATIGSSRDNDFVIACPGVSRRHATITRMGEKALLNDLGSKNRLIFRGHRTASIEIAPGDVVQIGRARLLLERISSSDARPGLAIDVSPSSSASSVSRSTSASVVRGGGPADALHWVREVERTDRLSASRRRGLLEKAHEIGGVDVFVVGQPAGDDFALKEVVGLVPAGEDLCSIGSNRRWFVVPLQNGDLFAAHIVQASLSDWQREFLQYVVDKMFRAEAGEETVADVDGELVYPVGMIVGGSARMRELFEQIGQSIRGDLHILLRGETGTGKELFARMIHESTRPGRPFKVVNSPAIPAELIEAEAFGIKGGVASGVEKRNGIFVEAGDGTVFLDEIGDLPPKLQGKLLRVLQEHEVVPVGSSVPVKIAAQVMSSTNKNLEQMIREGTFRQDLYYRLRGLEFVLPPLRERREEIRQFVAAFAQRAAAATHKKIRGVSEKAVQQLLQYDWPGNIRELKSAVDRAVALCPNGLMLDSRYFDLPRDSIAAPRNEPPTDLESLEIEAIRDALRRTGGNKARAARLLGVSRQGLYLMMNRHRIR